MSGASSGHGEARTIKDAPLAREMVERVDDFAGRVEAKRVELAPRASCPLSRKGPTAGWRILRPTISAALTPVYATWPVANSSKFSSCSGTSACRPRNGIRVANRDCAMPLITNLASSLNREPLMERDVAVLISRLCCILMCHSET